MPAQQDAALYGIPRPPAPLKAVSNAQMSWWRWVQAGRGRPTSSGGKRPSRCMQCATCLKPQLKKACLRNKALRSMGSLDRLPSLDRMPSLDAISIEAPPPEPSSRPSPSPEAASTPSKASAQRYPPLPGESYA